MGRSDVEDPKLAEVKAILARLQRMSPDDAPDLPVIAAAGASAVAPPPAVAADVKPAAILPTADVVRAHPAAAGRTFQLTALLAGAAALAMTLYAIQSHWRHEPAASPVARLPATPPVEPARPAPVATATAAVAPATSTATEPLSDKAALQQADRLIRDGAILAARSLLLGIADRGTADVAWALARAFDPTVIGRIAAADGRPDIDEAAKWYRHWHAIAVRQGLVADSVSIERIIRSMRP